MANTYTLHVAGLTRELTICKVNDHMDIAAFIMLGDAELTVAAATELLKKCPEFDILLTAEAKGIPLAHDGALGLLGQRIQRLQRAAGGDNVVHHEDALAAHLLQLRAVDDQLLLALGGDGLVFHDDGVLHVELDALACADVGLAALAAHLEIGRAHV